MSGHIPGPFKAYEGDDPFIFVCCAHEDLEEVYPDIEYLHNAGYRIWYHQGIDASEDSYEKITQKISECSYFLVFLSPKALETTGVPREVLFAIGKKKPVLPVYLSELSMTSSLEFALVRTLKLKKDELPREEYLRQLMRTIPKSSRSPSIDEEFSLMVVSRIEQAGGWTEEKKEEITERLMIGADLLGLERDRAQKVLKEKLDALGLTGEYERFRTLVGFFLDSGEITPQIRSILKNQATERKLNPRQCEKLIQQEAAFRARALYEHGEVQAAKRILVSSVGESALHSTEVRELLGQLDRKMTLNGTPQPHEEEEPRGSHTVVSSVGSGVSENKPDGFDEACDSVYTTVFAPSPVCQGETFLVQVFAHLMEQAEEAKELAVEFDPEAQRRMVKTLDTRIARGTRLTFDLAMRGLGIDDPVQSLIWNGRPESVQFGVTVPSEHQTGTVIGTVTVSQDSVPIGHIKFKLEIAAASSERSPQEAEPVGDDARRYTKAFVSYASKDLDRVRPRVQMLSLQGIDYFHDKFGLEPGDRWEKKIYLNIDQCDLFLLFWSSAAKESEWVRKEVNYALDRKAGDDFALPEIHPIIIEGPPVPGPWEELAHLHFDDWRVHYDP